MTSRSFSPYSGRGESLNRWDAAGAEALSSQNLSLLIDNKIPFIRVADFATQHECGLLASEAVRNGFDAYRNVDPPIDRIGCTVFEFNAISASAYFDAAQIVRALQQRIFVHSFDPVQRVIDRLRSDTGRMACVAEERGHQYYAGLIRRIEKGTLLHIDFAPIEQSGWSVCNITHQLAWNLYARVSDDSGGATHVYERQFHEGDQRHRSGTYGFDRKLVEASARASFKPRTGELVIFNTKNYHEVEPTKGDRITVNSAIGLTNSGGLVLWS